MTNSNNAWLCQTHCK